LVVALVVAGHEKREERVKVKVLELMVVLFGSGDGFWKRIQKRLKEVIMMMTLEVEIKVMEMVW